MKIINELINWSNTVLEDVDFDYSPNIHVDEIIDEFSINSSHFKKYTIGNIIDIYLNYIKQIIIDHGKYKISLEFHLESKVTPRLIKSFKQVQNKHISRMHTPPFFQISVRTLDLLTDSDEFYRIPLQIIKLTDFDLNILIFFEARRRATDIDDGDISFTRSLIIEPIVNQI